MFGPCSTTDDECPDPTTNDGGPPVPYVLGIGGGSRAGKTKVGTLLATALDKVWVTRRLDCADLEARIPALAAAVPVGAGANDLMSVDVLLRAALAALAAEGVQLVVVESSDLLRHRDPLDTRSYNASLEPDVFDEVWVVDCPADVAAARQAETPLAGLEPRFVPPLPLAGRPFAFLNGGNKTGFVVVGGQDVLVLDNSTDAPGPIAKRAMGSQTAGMDPIDPTIMHETVRQALVGFIERAVETGLLQVATEPDSSIVAGSVAEWQAREQDSDDESDDSSDGDDSDNDDDDNDDVDSSEGEVTELFHRHSALN